MLDRFNRRIYYLRISVTDRCNLRCVYCMPTEGVSLIPRHEILSFEEICEVATTAVEMGMDRIRLTGGEPLVRRNIVDLVSMIAEIEGVRDLAMTTNGVLLEEFAKPLVEAGLRRVNISLDTMDADRYAYLTGGGDIRRVLAGIEAAKKAGLTPIKLNCVVRESSDEPDAQQVAQFADQNGLIVRFIRQMNIAEGTFWVVQGGTGGNCAQCNRLRLTSNGMIKPCLFNDIMFSVRELGIRDAIERAVEAKPERGIKSVNHTFYNVGG
ncbi:radical SAM protein [candidate division WOR_3 bacterium SM1_77]|uniref:Radical SAM protein n=1 Tax=candidate division WOR_3 bacterium SM1_77 TaxID=1703778 RepID=A0A0S8JY44_UNCW3|nr:MAG: radical SAM protein [candidate division WOR_3 bacterium SM1_77]